MIHILQKYGMLFLVGPWPHGPLGGLGATLILAGLGLAGSLPIALLLGLARISPWRLLRWPASAWVYGLRGIPLIMIIFWAYYLLPVIIGDTVPPFPTALCAIIVYEAAFLAEIVRAGIQGLPPGQMEAARSAGLSYVQAMVHVVLPQALANMLPSMVNQFVSTIKATSIVYIIGVQEITYVAQQINTIEVADALQTYLILAIAYFLLCMALSSLAKTIERRLRLRQAGVSRPAGRPIRPQFGEAQ